MLKSANNETYQILIKWLISTRESKGLNIRELADLLDVDNPTINRIENLQRRLDVGEYLIYCKALELDPIQGLELAMRNSKLGL